MKNILNYIYILYYWFSKSVLHLPVDKYDGNNIYEVKKIEKKEEKT